MNTPRQTLKGTTSSLDAILLMAYGSPFSESEVEQYLTDIRRGRKPTLEQVADLKRRYREIGGHSPLLNITEAQASGLASYLQFKGMDVAVHYGMKHWHPYVAETIQKLLIHGTQRLALVLAPHYSRMSIGGYRDLVQNALENTRIHLDFIESWHDNVLFHKVMAERIVKGFTKFSPGTSVRVLFTAHSLPERIIAEGDPYSMQLLESCKKVADLVNISNWSLAYQSAGHTEEKWLGPDILDVLADMQPNSNVLVVPIGFVADHLEILYDIDVKAQAYARSHSLNLNRTESLNASPSFIAVLADIVGKRLPLSE